MSNYIHEIFLTKCSPRKRRPTWRRTVVDVFILLALSALTGWLLALVRGSLISHSVTCYRMPGLATIPVPVLAMDGHRAAALACLAVGLPGIAWAVFWGVRKLKKWDEEAAETRWAPVDADGWPTEYAGYLQPHEDEDPLALPAPGLNVEELRRILGSLLQQIQEARDLVKRAQGHLSVEDYGNDLDHAYLLMGLATTCLAELLTKTDPGLKSKEKPHGVKSAYRDVDGWVLMNAAGDPLENWPEGWPEIVNRDFLEKRGIELQPQGGAEA